MGGEHRRRREDKHLAVERMRFVDIPFPLPCCSRFFNFQIEADGAKSVKVKLIACISSAHGVSDVNSISWCPRPGLEDIFATAGDDYAVRVWKVTDTA